LTAHRVDVELYVRWMQETRRYKPSTISRRLSVVIGFYRTAVIDGVLTASPADHVRRPHVPAESPTLGLPHCSSKRCCRRRGPASTSTTERAVDHREEGPILRNRQGARMDRHAATRRLHHLADNAGINLPRMHPHMLRHTFVTTMLDAGVDLRDVQIAARHADPRTTMRYDRARKNLDRHPNYILAAYMASGT
jgi:site-specific recombinase XerD